MTKQKQELFELISKEEVILFVGAGMSQYAGYPSGSTLARDIYEGLSDEHKKQINLTEDLPKLTDEVYYLQRGKKKYLFEMLEREFLKDPSKTTTHDLLAKISQFKTIITTNYDNLFEQTNNKLQIIRKSEDYPKADLRETLLFKIHGDLLEKDRIILTKADYNRYFSNSGEDTIFWNAVKDKMAANHILFIGYSLDDPNIDVIIQKIINQLGKSRKKMFFVSPSATKPKQGFLKKNKIEFIKQKGEIFISDLFEYLQLNYFINLKKGFGTPSVALDFSSRNNLNLGLQKEETGLKVIPKDFKIDFKFGITSDNEYHKIKKLINYESFEDLVIENNEIANFSQFVKGFKIDDGSDIEKLIIKRVPFLKGPIEIAFEDGENYDINEFEIVAAKPEKNQYHFKIMVKDFTIEIIIIFQIEPELDKFNITIIPNHIISSTTSSVKFYEIIGKLNLGLGFEVYKNQEKLGSELKFTPLLDNKPMFILEYLKNLQIIERHFKIRFKNINLKEINLKVVEYILLFINYESVNFDFNEYIFDIKNFMKLDEILEKKSFDLYWESTEYSELELHGEKFKLGKATYFIREAYLANYEVVKSGRAKNLTFKSKKSTCELFFIRPNINLIN